MSELNPIWYPVSLVGGIALVGGLMCWRINSCHAKYEVDISFIEADIKQSEVNEESALRIMRSFNEITRNNLDKERSERAFVEFLRKFKDILPDAREV